MDIDDNISIFYSYVGFRDQQVWPLKRVGACFGSTGSCGSKKWERRIWPFFHRYIYVEGSGDSHSIWEAPIRIGNHQCTQQYRCQKAQCNRNDSIGDRIESATAQIKWYISFMVKTHKSLLTNLSRRSAFSARRVSLSMVQASLRSRSAAYARRRLPLATFCRFRQFTLSTSFWPKASTPSTLLERLLISCSSKESESVGSTCGSRVFSNICSEHRQALLSGSIVVYLLVM